LKMQAHHHSIGSTTIMSRECKKYVKANNGSRSSFSPAENDDGTTCDAIRVTRSELGDEGGMKQDAKDALGLALQEEELHVKDVRGELFVGNRRGLNLAERFRILEQQVGGLQQQVAEIPSMKTKIASLEDRVSGLTCSLDSYKLLRKRFISTYKRDKFENATDSDRKIIGVGNLWAHGGDAVVDAQLYQDLSGRRDFSVFTKLYGLLPETVQRISE
jgi:hypothetical protein